MTDYLREYKGYCLTCKNYDLERKVMLQQEVLDVHIMVDQWLWMKNVHIIQKIL